jgi:hypothetical protein
LLTALTATYNVLTAEACRAKLTELPKRLPEPKRLPSSTSCATTCATCEPSSPVPKQLPEQQRPEPKLLERKQPLRTGQRREQRSVCSFVNPQLELINQTTRSLSHVGKRATHLSVDSLFEQIDRFVLKTDCERHDLSKSLYIQPIERACFIHAGWLCAASEVLNASCEGAVDVFRKRIAQYANKLTKRSSRIRHSSSALR